MTEKKTNHSHIVKHSSIHTSLVKLSLVLREAYIIKPP